MIFHLSLLQFVRGLGAGRYREVSRDPVGNEHMLTWTSNGIEVTLLQSKKRPMVIAKYIFMARGDPKMSLNSPTPHSSSRHLGYRHSHPSVQREERKNVRFRIRKPRLESIIHAQ